MDVELNYLKIEKVDHELKADQDPEDVLMTEVRLNPVLDQGIVLNLVIGDQDQGLLLDVQLQLVADPIHEAGARGLGLDLLMIDEKDMMIEVKEEEGIANKNRTLKILFGIGYNGNSILC